MRENLTYCVILPAYNEGRHLATVVSRIPDWAGGIIIVDDASTDDTLRVAESLTDPRVRVQRHEKNRGVGGAMVTGFKAALDGGFDVAIKIDADDQMDVRELPILVRPIELRMAEYVKGNRFRRTGRPSSMPRLRWFVIVPDKSCQFFRSVCRRRGFRDDVCRAGLPLQRRPPQLEQLRLAFLIDRRPGADPMSSARKANRSCRQLAFGSESVESISGSGRGRRSRSILHARTSR